MSTAFGFEYSPIQVHQNFDVYCGQSFLRALISKLVTPYLIQPLPDNTDGFGLSKVEKIYVIILQLPLQYTCLPPLSFPMHSMHSAHPFHLSQECRLSFPSLRQKLKVGPRLDCQPAFQARSRLLLRNILLTPWPRFPLLSRSLGRKTPWWVATTASLYFSSSGESQCSSGGSRDTQQPQASVGPGGDRGRRQTERHRGTAIPNQSDTHTGLHVVGWVGEYRGGWRGGWRDLLTSCDSEGNLGHPLVATEV